jgi:hypothetical protein
MASWTEKCVSQLKLLHEEGFSATVIAKKLGPDFTKGMVLGKMRRLVLAEAPKHQETRKTSVQRVIPPKEVPARRLSPPPPSRIVLPSARGPDPQATEREGVQLYDLHVGQCRWPVGNDKPARYFCGEQTVNSSSWCDLHQRMAFPNLGKPAVRLRAPGRA